MTKRLANKVAIVLGAGSIGPGWGNGKATAVAFAREGAKVVCVDINVEAAQETAKLIADEGGVALALRADVTKSDDIARVVETTRSMFGRIDILDNNVGIAAMGGVVEIDEAEWDRVFAVNLKSCYLAMKHVIPAMVAQGGGAIVNISSVASIRYTGLPYSTYYATKAAMNHLTATTAVEYAAKKVRVNAILPGLMKTPMVEKSSGIAKAYAAGDVEEMWKKRDAQCPMGHMGTAWDVAHAAVFLASDEAAYVTGVLLPVDGGLTVKF
ncbi:MAG: SDR family oxidoreductase [Methylobacteriaceae bacterium]|nr:SDR family oxidoreductase [Methylobacteriaceae bacterium]